MDVAPSIVGNSRIIASYNSGDETRTTVKNDGGWQYSWSETDAIGVVKQTPGAKADADPTYSKVPGMFSYSGSAFAGMMQLAEGATYYGFYPYSAKASNGSEVTLTIPENQLFVVDDTFAPGMAPSIGVGTCNADNELEMSFKAVASYIRVPVVGKGEVTEVTLVVKNDNGDVQKIAGDVTVDYTAIDAKNLAQSGAIKAEKVDGASATEITLYAEEGVKLSTTEPHYFWFVIAPTADIASIQLTFKNGEGNAVTAVRSGLPIGEVGTNRALTIRQTASNDFNIDMGSGNVYTISTPLHFLKYVYAATNGTTGVDEDLLKGDKTLKEAVIINDIDMSTALDEITKAEAGEYKVSDYEYKVYGAYKSAQSIPSIGGEAAYVIKAVDNREVKNNKPVGEITPINIKNLTVKDVNGLFVGDKNVENLNFENLQVNATARPNKDFDMEFVGEKKTEKHVVFFLTNGTMDGIENVTFDEASAITAPNAYEQVPVLTALVGEDTVDDTYAEVDKNKKPVAPADLVFDAYPTLPGNVNFYAAALNIEAGSAINVGGTNDDAVKAKSVPFATLQKFVTLVPGEASVLFVPNFTKKNGGNDILKWMDANTVDGNEAGGANNVWFSMLGKDGTSYWTGRKALGANTGALETLKASTAEQLLKAVEDGGETVTLANDIYLSKDYASWPVQVLTAAKTITVNGEDHKIYGAKIDGTKIYGEELTQADATAKSTTVYYTLFGATAVVNKLVVDDVEIKVKHFGKPADADTYTAVVATLANTVYVSSKYTENNTVSNVVIDATAYAKDLYAGGIAATLPSGSYKTNTISGVTFNQYAGSVKNVAQACGDFAGEFKLSFNPASVYKPTPEEYSPADTEVTNTLTVAKVDNMKTEGIAFGIVKITSGTVRQDGYQSRNYLWNSPEMKRGGLKIKFAGVAPQLPAEANWVNDMKAFPTYVTENTAVKVPVVDESGEEGAEKTLRTITLWNEK